jgi:nickel-dependent lactate racemase
MMEIHLPFGSKICKALLPEGIQVDIIQGKDHPPAEKPLVVVQEALENLLGGVNWGLFEAAKSVAIAVNDKTRSVPHVYLLPPLLEKLGSIGIARESIILYIAVGTHPPMTPDEFPQILPDEILQNYDVVSHDSEDITALVNLGKTSRGTPVWANRDYVESDLKIVIGNIEPHQFAGFSGGVKSAAIGLAGVDTINQNHKLMTLPESIIGEYHNNPARQDIEEIGHHIGVDLAVSAILNHDRGIVHALAGEPAAVMQAGISISRSISVVFTKHNYDLVVTSPGGHPKDINVYQAQKGLAHAALITKPAGTIILVAACPEGSGSAHYEEWVRGKGSHTEVISQFLSQGFRIGPHKAFQISRDASQFSLMTFTEMEKSLARMLLLNPVESLQGAIDLALKKIGTVGKVAILPHASSTIPRVERC